MINRIHPYIRFPGSILLNTVIALILLAISNITSADESRFSLKTLMMPGPLTTAHEEYETQCEKCHRDSSDKSQTLQCKECHEAIEKDIDERQGFHGNIYTNTEAACNSCHSEHEGRKADIIKLQKSAFDHDLTDFVLEGQHRETPCDSCHIGDKQYAKTPANCVDCHESDDYHDGGMGETCKDCHDEEKWTTNRFDHNKATDYPLQGSHKAVPCNACHLDNNYTNVADKCSSCHRVDDIHDNKRGAECQQCHLEEAWDNVKFDHDNETDFPLSGGHSDLSCERCHKKQMTPGRTTTVRSCADCHSTDDVHFGTNGADCDSCHSNGQWTKTSFDHNTNTDFPLTGSHKTAICHSCHTDNNKPKSSCDSCHFEDDVHSKSMGTDCAQCHNTSDWTEKVRFNHDLTTFPLIGLHTLAQCEDCHSQKPGASSPRECSSCHESQDIHKGTLGMECSQCHNPNDWQRWIFNHDTQTDFVLDGKHGSIRCSGCHHRPLKEISEDPQNCYLCHKQDDVHRRRFGQDCARCHSTETFRELRIRQP